MLQAVGQRFQCPPPGIPLIYYSSLQNSEKHWLNRSQVHYKGYSKGHRWTARRKRCIEFSVGEWAQSFHTLPRFPQVHQSGNSLKLLLLDFFWRLHFLCMLIKSLAVSDWTQSPAPLPSPEVGPGWGLGRVLKVATLISYGSLYWQPALSLRLLT